jgi:peptide/nickel transport system permease protein
MVDDAMHDALGLPGRIADVARHLILPVSTLALVTMAVVARHHRAAMLDVLPRAFVRTVRAKGVRETQVLLAHVLPNALGPALVLAGLQLPALVGGAVIVETIFSWPGMGRVLIAGVTARDPFLVVAIALVTSLVVTIGGLLTDLGAAALDPRRRAELR